MPLRSLVACWLKYALLNQFDNYYMSRAAHERALEASGLREVEWVEPKLSPECDSEPEYWNDFFVDPSVIFLQCRK